MNICLLNDSFPPVIDGVANVVVNYAGHLRDEHGARVIVGTPGYPGAAYDDYPYPVVPYRSFAIHAAAGGYRAGDPFEERSVAALRAFGPDIIHSHCPAVSNIMARLLRETTGAPVVFTYHTKYDIDINRAVKLKPVAQEGIRAMVAGIEPCDEVWVVSRGAGENLRSLGFRGSYRVMANGVDFARGRAAGDAVAKATAGYDLPEGVPVYLYVGRLITYKGLPLLLDALKLLKDGGHAFRMIFVGKGPDRELLEEKAADLGLMEGDAKCVFTGAIYDREELRAWNTRADLFLFPSTFDTNGLVVREAAACGLASVLIRGSCAAEDVVDGRNGFLIDESAEAMAALLSSLTGREDAVRAVGRRAMEELYLSWSDSVAAAYDRYQAILEEKRRGLLPEKKRDLLITAAARRFDGPDRLRELGRRQLVDLRKTAQGVRDDLTGAAAGMMENISSAGENAERLWEELAESFRQALDIFRR